MEDLSEYFSKEDLDEFFTHSLYTEQYVTEQLKSDDEEAKEQLYSLLRLFTLKPEAVPPDHITAKALRLMADGLDAASERLGKEPEICKEFRKVATIQRKQEKESKGGSAWE